MFRINDRFQHLLTVGGTCAGLMDYPTEIIVIASLCVVGVIWAIIQVIAVERINVIDDKVGEGKLSLTYEQRHLIKRIGDRISSGAKSFLKEEYTICLIFIAIMFILIGFVTQYHWWTAVAFLIGALVSITCGIIGMVMATRTNYKVTYCAVNGMSDAFKTAYRAGCVMGFALVSIGLLVLTVVIVLYKRFMNLPDYSANANEFLMLFEAVAGYGLGGSFVALFGRVGGGIYTKAAAVGADLVGKVESGLPEDSPRNPATIADNVGDNVGDVAGMSADLFGSFAESTCAALVLSCNTLVGTGCDFYISNFFYPLLIIAFGIFICILVSTLAIFCMKVDIYAQIETTLKVQLIVSTLILVGMIYLAAAITYPASFELRITGHSVTGRTPVHPFLCSIFGLVSGLIIAAFTEYMTSHSYKPVRDLAQSCISGAGANITLGLALGYLSTVVPALLIAITAYFANLFLGFYGVALAALGMLANLPISLAIDGYGPISDNAGGISEMAELGHEVREVTDALDAAGNTTAAIGKGFAIGSAVLVSLSLYGGFLHNAGLSFSTLIALTQPEIFTGLLLGAMLPYLFSAFTIKSVGDAAQGMVREVRNQIRRHPGILDGTEEPDYDACIAISARASLIEMIAPGLLVRTLLLRSSFLPSSSASSSDLSSLLASFPEPLSLLLCSPLLPLTPVVLGTTPRSTLRPTVSSMSMRSATARAQTCTRPPLLVTLLVIP
jgi:H+-translocating diphosphatase